MKTLDSLVSLALVTAVTWTSGVNADPLQRLRHRRAVAFEDAVTIQLEEGADALRVILVAREQAPVGVLATDPVERRRQVADGSTAAIRDILARSPRASLSAADGSAPPPTTYLWAANAVAATVTRQQLAELEASGELAKVILDREVRWLDLGMADDAPPSDAGTGDGGPPPCDQGSGDGGPPQCDEPPSDQPPGGEPPSDQPPGGEPPGDQPPGGEPPGDQPPGEPVNYGLEKIGALSAREEFGATGAGIRVGHIDTGVDPSHPALAGKVIAFKDFIQGQADSYDDQGHGTHSAGSIVAEGVGVAPAAKLIVAKSLNAQGSGTLSQLMEGMQWMLDPDGDPSTDDRPHLVSNSWGADRAALGDGDEVFRDVVKAWREAGIVPVFAAGNSGFGTQAVPGGYPEAFAVGATDQDDQSANFSTGGPGEWDGVTLIKPDVSAPGVAILSTMPGGSYDTMNGTSMACPHVAGAVALVLEKHPDLGVDALQQAFMSASEDLGESGRDGRFGEGRIDVHRTLQQLGARGPQVASAAAWDWVR